jgi:hypothetical protein
MTCFFFGQQFFGGPLKKSSHQDLVSQSAPVMPYKFFLNSLEIFYAKMIKKEILKYSQKACSALCQANLQLSLVWC